MPQLLTGGPFRLGETLGAGAQATVYAGTHARFGRPLAFKVAATPDGNAELLAEYRALRSVRHPNVVGAHALIRLDDGRCALVLDRIFGQSLDRHAALPKGARVEIALGLTRAVAALHGRGLVHGDISPPNVMIDVQPTSVRTCLIDPGPGRDASGVDGTIGDLAPRARPSTSSSSWRRRSAAPSNRSCPISPSPCWRRRRNRRCNPNGDRASSPPSTR